MNNFNVQRELAEQSPLDWKFGALSQPGIVSIPLTEREAYLPLGETQFAQFGDFTDCASRSPVNHLEALFTYHYRHSMKDENKLWMETKGYIHDGRVTFSDRYIAVLSGTTHDGNSLKSPLEAIRKQGLIPKALLPKTDTMTWTDYYAPVPQALQDLGQEFLTRFTLNYEQVAHVHFADVLKDDCLGVAGHAWPQPQNGVYPKTTGAFNHAFLLYTLPQWHIFDNYDPFTKTLAADFSFFDYGYRVYLSQENVPQKKSPTWSELFYAWLASLTPLPMPPVPPKPVNPFRERFCLAIKAHEGWYPGSRSYRNNNQGNCKFSSVGYLPIYGIVGHDPQNFAIFKDPATGWLYLNNLIKSKASQHPEWSIYEFFQSYAPSADNNDPLTYAKVVAKALGVDAFTWPMKNLL